MTDRAFDCDQSIAIMFGHTTLCIAAPTTGKRSGRSTSSMRCPAGDCVANAEREYSRECLAIRVDRKLNSGSVIDVLSDLFILRGIPSFIRSDNGPEFVAQAVQDWIQAVGARTAYIEPGSPWENGYCESFNARFRDEFLNGEIFYSLREAQILTHEDIINCWDNAFVEYGYLCVSE